MLGMMNHSMTQLSYMENKMNEEKLKQEFEIKFPFEKYGYSLTELHFKIWKEAYQSGRDAQRESDADLFENIDSVYGWKAQELICDNTGEL